MLMKRKQPEKQYGYATPFAKTKKNNNEVTKKPAANQ